MREITLEFLREGPAHNQLLSPLTQYLVLCANRPAQSLRLTFEHREFLKHLAALRYAEEGQGAREASRMHLEEVENLISDIVNRVGGLEAETGVADGGWSHLRLILGPAELSLLPFEIARCPDSFPGSELPLALNAEVPIAITREIRQVRSRAYNWPTHPRVLIALTDLPGASVPGREHLAVIRRALDPWVGPDVVDGGGLSSLWTVIEQASPGKILDACRQVCYTHVHVLAHGGQITPKDNRGYGMVLHDDSGHGRQIVNGLELANALCQPRQVSGGSHGPAVVVLASCDSGAPPDMVYTGASMAQQLHGAGIPFVIASQYPLSKVGSVVFAKQLYPRLLRGEDPRRALYVARQELKTCVPSTHDWVSVVAYAALPEDLDRQLQAVRIKRIHELLKVAKAWRYRAGERGSVIDRAPTETSPQAISDSESDPAEQASEERWSESIETAAQWLEHEVESIEAAPADLRETFTEVCGLLAVEFKRAAEMSWDMSRRLDPGSVAWRRPLERSRHWYEAGHRERVLAGKWSVSHWGAGQYLCLTAVLEGQLIGQDALWLRARASAHADLYAQDLRSQVWAMGSLWELWMLRPLTDPSPPDHFWTTAEDRATEHLDDLKRWSTQDSVFRDASERQLKRYIEWWGKAPEISSAFAKVVAIAEELLQRLESA